MNREKAQQLEAQFFALPNVTARRAFVLALETAGHRCFYCEEWNGKKVRLFRMFADDGGELAA